MFPREEEASRSDSFEIGEGRPKKTRERNTVIKEESYKVLSRPRCWPNNADVIPVLILPTWASK